MYPMISPTCVWSHAALASPPVTGTHQWKKFLQPQEIARMGADAGLRVEDVTGLIYNPITNTWRLDKNDIDVNFAMCLKGERGQGQRGKA